MKRQTLLITALSVFAALNGPADVLELKNGKTLNGKSLRTFPLRFNSLSALFLALMVGGCGSLGGPGSASFASVTIHQHSADEIVAATAKVFGADGYAGARTGPDQMVFQKEASRATTLSREGLVAAHEGARTLNRVRVELVSLGEGSHRLQCEAFVVTGAGDSFFEEEVRLTNLRSAPYQALLNKVANQLK